MAEENYSTYHWGPVTNNIVSFGTPTIEDSTKKLVTIKATITKNNIFALIAGTYQVTVEGTYKIDELEATNEKDFEILCTAEITNPKLCTTSDDRNYTVELTLTGELNIPQDAFEYKCTGNKNDFKIKIGKNNYPNEYLYILKMPELITNLTIDGRSIGNTYVKGSALPINEIQNISTIDFHDIKINNVQQDIFYKLDNNTNIATKTLVVPELTVVDLPESEDKPIIICKSRSKNKGVTFKTKDPDIGNRHFGYIIDIKGYRSAGYNSVWVNRETLDEIFPNMPADIMSTTQMFECKDSFNFHELTYEVHDVAAPNWVNNQGQEFTSGDQNKLNTYAPTYKAVTINQSTGDSIRHNDMILKNIEFVKFGEKVIKLNYKPLYEA
jgi:hypothetical protein